MLNNDQIAQVKGLLKFGHKQHDIAAYFGVNGGRIAEVSTGKVGAGIAPAKAENLPNINHQKVRYFTTKQSVKEQEEILADLIERPSDAARVYTISPELAEIILEKRNGGNRQPSSKKIAEYIEAMNENRWPITGATIVFSKSGFLLDGQHRLLACVRSQIPLKTFVVFGIDDGAFTLIDIGRKRTNVDAFAIAKVQNSRVAAKVTRWLVIFDNDPNDRGITLSNDEALRWYNDHVDKKLFEECVRLSIQIEKETKARRTALPCGSMGAMLYLFAKKSKKDMQEFASLFIAHKGAARTCSIVLKEAMHKSGGRIHEVYRNAVIVLAWNAFREGKRTSSATLEWTGEKDFPVIK